MIGKCTQQAKTTRAQHLAPGASHSQERESLAIDTFSIVENQGSMAARIKHFLIGQCSIGQVYKHLLKLGAIDLPGMMFKDAYDTILHEMKSQRMEIANIAEQASALTPDERVLQRT